MSRDKWDRELITDFMLAFTVEIEDKLEPRELQVTSAVDQPVTDQTWPIFVVGLRDEMRNIRANVAINTVAYFLERKDEVRTKKDNRVRD